MGALIIYTVFYCSLLFRSAEVYSVPELRTYYHKATKCAETGEAFHKFMEHYDGNEPVIIAFKGASEAVMAKYTWSPYNKMKFLKTSSVTFSQAVKLDPNDPEIRFLRYTVEFYVPRYLNMSNNVEEDKSIVLNGLLRYPKSGIDAESCKIMRDFLLTGNHCSELEKQKLRTIKI